MTEEKERHQQLSGDRHGAREKAAERPGKRRGKNLFGKRDRENTSNVYQNFNGRGPRP